MDGPRRRLRRVDFEGNTVMQAIHVLGPQTILGTRTSVAFERTSELTVASNGPSGPCRTVEIGSDGSRDRYL
jgi:hypothetical protein